MVAGPPPSMVAPVCWKFGKLASEEAAEIRLKVTELEATPGARATTRVTGTALALGSRTEVSAWPLASAAAARPAPRAHGRPPGCQGRRWRLAAVPRFLPGRWHR